MFSNNSINYVYFYNKKHIFIFKYIYVYAWVISQFKIWILHTIVNIKKKKLNKNVVWVLVNLIAKIIYPWLELKSCIHFIYKLKKMKKKTFFWESLTYGVHFWRYLFIIKPNHQSVFGIDEN